ncbi:MAG: Bifunctional uridylyltransferase/uridylyl-removing enzyme [bacterium ADurb.Bin478]|nr:MAG: Bifunctional uridylyltransferase/uridylyl-removing enzyme [bacterium ADurb.Bin478]
MSYTEQLHRLKIRCLPLGNQHRKYLYTISEHLEGLARRIEKHGAMERIHLWYGAPSYDEEMARLSRWGETEEEKLADLGCYFALQFLHLKLTALDSLAVNLLKSRDHQQEYKQFMLWIGHGFRRITAAYMRELLKIFLPPEAAVEFVVMGVGTRSDQDDIDLGVVDRGYEGRDVLTTAIARMNAEMLKKAIGTHYHLSEHVCSDDSYAASIEDYQELLQSEIHDFVIINEMLGAARILGSRRLFFDFRKQVTLRYYFNRHQPEQWKFHEGYLRGIVGEVRSFALRDFAAASLNPKVDGLRMIKASLYAAKTMFNLRQVNAWALLEALQYRDPGRRAAYVRLESALTFLEMFRYLYQLLVAEEEEIFCEDASAREQLSVVAEAMGFRQNGAAKPVDRLVADYFRHARTAKEVTLSLLPDVVGHLSSISSFTRLPVAPAPGLSDRLLNTAQFFRGTRFWDDVMIFLRQAPPEYFSQLVEEIKHGHGDRPSPLVRWVDWGQNSYFLLFAFINLLFERGEGQLGEAMFREFLQREITADQVRRISVVFNHYPKMMVDLIENLSEQSRRGFYERLQIEVWDRRLFNDRDRLCSLIKLQFTTSRFVRRILTKVVACHPQFIDLINQPDALAAFGRGLCSQVDQVLNYRERRRKLAEYHDFEFLRVCRLALTNTSNSRVAEEYIGFSDAYLQQLFHICSLEVDAKDPARKPDRSLISILVTGGYGHCLAFDDDYDLIILVDSESAEIKAYYEAILTRMHTEIARSGILPHYRLAEYTGSFACTIRELKTLLQNQQMDTFVDQSQLLGARMVVGSDRLRDGFYEFIVRPHIFGQKHDYSRAMLEEIRHRHQVYATEKINAISLKESPGGLRDIEMMLDIFRAQFEVAQQSNYAIFHTFQTILPEYANQMIVLARQYDFLRTMRNLHRLAIAADDRLNIEYLDLLAEIVSTSGQTETKAGLLEKINSSMAIVKSIQQELIEEVVLPRLEEKG